MHDARDVHVVEAERKGCGGIDSIDVNAADFHVSAHIEGGVCDLLALEFKGEGGGDIAAERPVVVDLAADFKAAGVYFDCRRAFVISERFAEYHFAPLVGNLSLDCTVYRKVRGNALIKNLVAEREIRALGEYEIADIGIDIRYPRYPSDIVKNGCVFISGNCSVLSFGFVQSPGSVLGKTALIFKIHIAGIGGKRRKSESRRERIWYNFFHNSE